MAKFLADALVALSVIAGPAAIIHPQAAYECATSAC